MGSFDHDKKDESDGNMEEKLRPYPEVRKLEWITLEEKLHATIVGLRELHDSGIPIDKKTKKDLIKSGLLGVTELHKIFGEEEMEAFCGEEIETIHEHFNESSNTGKTAMFVRCATDKLLAYRFSQGVSGEDWGQYGWSKLEKVGLEMAKATLDTDKFLLDNGLKEAEVVRFNDLLDLLTLCFTHIHKHLKKTPNSNVGIKQLIQIANEGDIVCMLHGINLVKSYYNMRTKQSRPQHICFDAVFPVVLDRLKAGKQSLRVENALRAMLTAVPHLDLVTIEQLGVETWAQILVRHGMADENTELTNAMLERRTKLAGINPHRYIAPPTIHESAVFYQVSEHTPRKRSYGPVNAQDNGEGSGSGSSTPTPRRYKHRSASKPADAPASSLDPSISLERLSRPNATSAEEQAEASLRQSLRDSSISEGDESDLDTHRQKRTKRPTDTPPHNCRDHHAAAAAARRARSPLPSSNSNASTERRYSRRKRVVMKTVELLQEAKERNAQLALIQADNPQARSTRRSSRRAQPSQKAISNAQGSREEEDAAPDDDGSTIKVAQPKEQKSNAAGNPAFQAMIANLPSRESSVASNSNSSFAPSNSPLFDPHGKYIFHYPWPILAATFHSHPRSLVSVSVFNLILRHHQREPLLAELVSAYEQERTPFAGGGMNGSDWREVEAWMQWDLDVVERKVAEARKMQRTMMSQLGPRGGRSLGVLLGEVEGSGNGETDGEGDSAMTD